MRACRTCKNVTDENVCPVCKGTEFSDDYSGILVVLHPEDSLLAEKLKAKVPGTYALKIR
ncbi:DNA-directed RNA polymerase subunit E'' [Candidatus Bathyarchaeota archaeon RBG_16_57_9]|nr:MAG: DNA-directed RNA polymerase subunit E'' [Candidatus Bathyarchaeota archaeon RBG_16_57_9]